MSTADRAAGLNRDLQETEKRLARVTAERDEKAKRLEKLAEKLVNLQTCHRADRKRLRMYCEQSVSRGKEIVTLSDKLAAAHSELCETKAALETAERKLACNPAHALDSAADKIDALRKRMAELPCTRCEKARADYDRLRKAWALAMLTLPEACSVAVAIPPDVAALIREHAGQDIGECTRCGQRAPLAWLPNGRACAWDCSTKASVT